MAEIEKVMLCTFCNKRFKRAAWFEKHTCDKKRRFERRTDVTSIMAHKLFKHWQKRTGLLRRGKTKDFEGFAKSAFYNTFMKLAEFTHKEYVISGFKYIDWLVDMKVPDHQWCWETGLESYRQYVLDTENAKVQAETTCKNIKVWCENHAIDLEKFFVTITPGQALNMVRENKLSPWVLFAYEPCVVQLTGRMDGEVIHTLNEHINVNYWITKVESDKVEFERVNNICLRFFNDT